MKRAGFYKRFAAMLCLTSILGATCALPLTANAAGDGYWELVDVELYGESIVDPADLHEGMTVYEFEKGYSNYKVKIEEGVRYTAPWMPSGYWTGEYNGHEEITISYDDPPERFSTNERIELVFDVKHESNMSEAFYYAGFTMNVSIDVGDRFVDFSSNKTGDDYGSHESVSEKVKFTFDASETKAVFKHWESVRAVLGDDSPEWFDDSFKTAILVSTPTGKVRYAYKWVEGAMPGGGGKTNIINTVAEKTPGETSVVVAAAIVMAVIGVAAAAVATGGGAAASGNGGGQQDGRDMRDDEEKEKSTFKMYLWKDFGDAIKYGGEAQAVYARMEEITPSGQVIHRDDLTARISISTNSPALALEEQGIVNDYKCAYVRAYRTGGSDPNEAVISFRFGGGESYFQNNVKFRLIGEPSLAFDKSGILMVREDQKDYMLKIECVDFVRPPETMTHEIIRGNEDFDVDIRNTEDPNKFIAVIENRSRTDRSADGAGPKACGAVRFTACAKENEEASKDLTVSLVNEGIFITALEQQYGENGELLVLCFADNFKSKEDSVVMERADFRVKLAVPEKAEAEGSAGVRVLEPKEYTVKFSPYEDTSEETRVLLSRYELPPAESVRGDDSHYYMVQPKTALPEAKGGSAFDILLPIAADYQGETYELKLPLRLVGLAESPMAGWDEEYARFNKLVNMFGMSSEIAAQLHELNKKRSTAELYILNQKILVDAREYYTDESKAYKEIGEQMDAMVDNLETLKFFGDQAFTILLIMKLGPKYAVWEPVISVAKDLLTQYIGECLAESNAFFEGPSNRDYDFMGKFRDLINGSIGDMIKKKPFDPRKAAAFVGLLFAIHVLSHYAAQDADEHGNRDMLQAVEDGFKSMTAFAIKNIMGKMFGEFKKWAMKDPGIVTTLGRGIYDRILGALPPDIWAPDAGNYVSSQLGALNPLEDDVPELVIRKAAVIDQMVTEYVKDWFGDGAKTVFKTIAKNSEFGLGVEAAGAVLDAAEKITDLSFRLVGDVIELQCTFAATGAVCGISIDVVQCAAKLAEFFYDSTVGLLGLPEPPEDVKIPPKYQP